MEEKILIKSKQYDVKKIFYFIVLVGIAVSFIWFCARMSDYMQFANSLYEELHDRYSLHQEQGYCFTKGDERICDSCETIENGFSKLSIALRNTFNFEYYDIRTLFFTPFLLSILIGILAYLWLKSYELTVTDKRIYGRVAWGKRVDLPLDSVSATATISLLKGISVSTSSGKISFLIIKNAEEIYKTINNLLIERQSEKKTANIQTTELKTDNADELKKFKGLLDSGVITQEEFDAKKKQLLGL